MTKVLAMSDKAVFGVSSNGKYVLVDKMRGIESSFAAKTEGPDICIHVDGSSNIYGMELVSEYFNDLYFDHFVYFKSKP